MILPDTNIWAHHFRYGLDQIAELARQEKLCCHPYIIAELDLGAEAGNDRRMRDLRLLKTLDVASHAEVMMLIRTRKLGGSGIGYVDAHLLASCLLHADCKLWTRDKRLQMVTDQIGIGFRPAG